MAQYIVRPTTLITNGAGTTPSTGATVLTNLGDNSDLTTVSKSGTSPTFWRFGLGTPSVPSDEYVCRIGSSARWSGGGNAGFGAPQIGLATFRSADVNPSSYYYITTTGTGTATTTEAGYLSAAWSLSDLSTLRVSWYDGRASSSQPTITYYDLWATIYTIKKATVTVANQTSTISYPVIATTTTATIDWEASTSDIQNLRKVRTYVQVESGGSGVGTGTIVAGGYVDTYFTASGSQTINVPLATAIPNGTYNIYSRAGRFREDGSITTETYGAWSAVATLTQSVTPPQTPVLSAAWDPTLQRVKVLAPANLITNGNFEAGVTGWTAGANSTLSQSATVAKFGTNSARLVATASGSNSMTTPTGVSGIAVLPNTSYAFGGWTYVAGMRGFTATITWYTSAGALISTSSLSSGPLSASFWTFIGVSGTSPSNAAYASLSLSISGVAPAEFTYFDGVTFAANATTSELAALASYADAAAYASGSQTWELQRSADGGVTWTGVRGASAGNSTAQSAYPQTWTVYDYEANRTVANLYRIRANGSTAGGTLTSNWSSSASVTPTYTTWNLKVPENAALNMVDVKITDKPSEQLVEEMGIFRPLGSRYPVIVSGTLGGWDGSMRVITATTAEWTALRSILESQKVLLLESPFGWARYVRIVNGAQTTMLGSSTAPRREVSVSYVEVAAP